MPKRDYKSYNILEEELAQGLAEDRQEQSLNQSINQIVAAELPKVEESTTIDQQVTCDSMEVMNEEKEKSNESIKEELKKEISQREAEPKENLFKSTKDKTQEKLSLFIETDKSRESKEKKIKSNKEVEFPEYKRYYQQKERSIWFKWIMWIAKITITLMLLPLIGMIGFGILGVVGIFLTVIATSVAIGFITLGSICFMSTQINASLVALGISVAITCVSFGGIILVIFLAITKWTIEIIKKYKKPRIKRNDREVK